MNLPDWVQQTLIAFLGALGTACVTVAVAVVRLFSRVSNLEDAMKRHEVHQSETAKVMTDALAELRAETRGVVSDIHAAREAALTTFVTKADIRDLIQAARQTPTN